MSVSGLAVLLLLTLVAADYVPCDDGYSFPGLTVECLFLPVPLSYSNASVGDITIFTRRLRPAHGAAPALHFLFLEGGPGLSEEGPDVYGAAFLANALGAAVYLPDRRGNGRSCYIDCPQLLPLSSCVAHVERTYGWAFVQHFSVENQARDLMAVISATPEMHDSGAEVVAYARSYGTYVAQRFMVHFPGVLARVVLDGVAPPDLLRTPVIDINQNLIGSDFFAHCAADDACRAAVGAATGGMAPLRALYSARHALQIGDADPACSADIGLDAVGFQRAMDALVNTWQLRPLMPAAAARLLRCGDGGRDAAALRGLMRFAGLRVDAEGSSGSPALNNSLLVTVNIILSELWRGGGVPPNVSCAEIAGFSFAASVAGGVADLYCPGAHLWRPYPRDPKQDAYPDPARTHMLLMNGDLDPATPAFWFAHAARKYGPRVAAVLMPRVCHTAAACSPLPGSYNPSNPLWFFAGSCGTKVLSSFLAAGAADTSCVADILPIDWIGRTNMTLDAAEQVFGVQSLY